MRKIIVALLILICFKSQAQITVASGFNVAAQQSADSKQYKLVSGKHVPYTNKADYLSTIPNTRRHQGEIGFITSTLGGIDIYQFIGGIQDINFVSLGRVLSFGDNAGGDSTILQMSDGKRYASIKGSGGGGTPLHFGIEDNVGVQDRIVDMQTFGLSLSNLSHFNQDFVTGGYFNNNGQNLDQLTYDPGKNVYVGIHQSGGIFQNSATDYTTFNGRYLTIEPNNIRISYITGGVSGGVKTIATSVNNIPADSTGNITISVSGGSGGVTNLTLGTATTFTQPITNSNGTGFTLSNFTTTAGLVPGTISDVTKFLRSDGSFAVTGTTVYDMQTASSGIITFTFVSVPVSYADYTIAVNGVLMRPGIDFTRSNNDITIPTITAGEYVEYRRIK